MLDRIAIARRTPDGWRATCPTTKREYLTTIATPGDDACVWLTCAECDASGHTGEDCDPTERQPHLYFMEAGDASV